MSGRKSGYTLAEVLLSGSLGAVLLTILVTTMVPVFRASAQNSIRIEMQQQAAVTLGRIRADLQETPLAGISLLAQSQASDKGVLSLHRIDTMTSGSPPTLVYRKELVVYVFSQGIIRRSQLPASSILRPVRLSQSRLNALDPSAGAVLARGVKGCLMRSALASPNLASPLTFDLEMATGLSTFSLRSSLSVRNSE